MKLAILFLTLALFFPATATEAAKAARCAAAGKMCKSHGQCCSGKCTTAKKSIKGVKGVKGQKGGVCTSATSACVVPNLGQCNGEGYKGCKSCAKGSACVYSTKAKSFCLPSAETPSFDPVRCAVEDGDQCGGEGYSGCQNCKVGSACVQVDEWSAICYKDGKAPNAAAPFLSNEELLKVASWVKGIEPLYDENVDRFTRRRMQGANNTDAEFDELRFLVSMAFASEKGLNKSLELNKTSQEFRDFNEKTASLMQNAYCAVFNSPSAQVSQFVKDCLCGSLALPVIHCAAKLEQEMIQTAFNYSVVVSSNRARDLEVYPSPSRDLQIAGCTFDYDGSILHFFKEIGLLVLKNDSSIELCVNYGCNVPMFYMFIETYLGFDACINQWDYWTIKYIRDLQMRRASASNYYVSVTGKVCVLTRNADIAMKIFLTALNGLGLDLCFLQIRGAVRPLLGVFEARILATITCLYAEGRLMYLYDNDVRNENLLCDGARCTDSSSRDCALCEGDLSGEIEVGIKLPLVNIKATLAQNNVVTGCRTPKPDGSCAAGVQYRDFGDGTACERVSTCELCKNPATFWKKLDSYACGTCLPANSPCAGMTCSYCCNSIKLVDMVRVRTLLVCN